MHDKARHQQLPVLSSLPNCAESEANSNSSVLPTPTVNSGTSSQAQDLLMDSMHCGRATWSRACRDH